MICVDRDRARIDERPAEPLGMAVDPEQRAYVIYTSGSSGEPKGVEVTHRSVANLVSYMRERPGLSERDVVANLTTPAFDLSVPDWYLPLTTGAQLLIVPREATLDGVELADWLARSGVTFVQATPTTWQLLVDAELDGKRDAEDRLRRRGALAARWRRSCSPGARRFGTCTGRPRRRCGRRF